MVEASVYSKKSEALVEINYCCDIATRFVQSEPLKEIIITKCQEENMVQYLFKDSPHPELTKKCSPLLQFTIDNNIFNENDIDIIWASSVDKHESIMHEVWKLFSDLNLPKPLLDHLYLKINSIPPINYDGKFVDFVKTLTDKAVFLHDLKNEPRRWYGLDFFWEQATMPGGNEYLKNQFLKALIECLSKDHFEIRRPVYLEYCVENLSKCDNFLQSRSSLTLLREILHCMNLSKEQRYFASWLNNPEHKVVEKIFRIISQYSPVNLSKDDLAISKLLLNYIFDFLEFFLPISESKLEKGQVDILWKHILRKFDVSEIIFKWLEKICNVGLVSMETLGYIFMDKFVEVDASLLTSPGFSLFETLFRLYNIEKQNIAENFKSEYLILTFNLCGLEELWEIAFQAIDKDVRRNTVALLSNIQRNLDKPLQTGVTLQRQSILDRLMQRLSTETNLNVIERCLEIIVELISNFEADFDPLLQHGYSPMEKKFNVKFYENAYTVVYKESFDVPIMDNKTLEDLRILIAQKMHEDPTRIKLTLESEKSGDDEITVTNFEKRINQIPQTKVIAKKAYTVTSSESNLSKALDNEYQAYSSLLSEHYFDPLFEKLSLPPPLCGRVWSLLMKLPTNVALKSKLFELTPETDWSSLLSTTNVYKLCYSLQIIDVISRTRDINEEWMSNFIKFGGLEYLINHLFFNVRKLLDPENGPHRFSCVTLLLKAIVFMSIDSGDSPKIKEAVTSIATINHFQIAQALLETGIIVATIPTSAASVSQISSILKYSLDWLHPLLTTDNSILESFLNNNYFLQWSEAIGLHPHQEIRAHAFSILSSSCFARNSPFVLQLFNKLIVLLDLIDSNYRRLNPYVYEYFLLLTKLVQTLSPYLNFESLVQKICAIVKKNRNIYIEEEYKEEQDFVKLGLLKVFLYALGDINSHLLQQYGPVLIEEICDVDLFELPNFGTQVSKANAPKLKLPSSRADAYMFLASLGAGSRECFLMILNKLIALQNSFESPKHWGLTPRSYERASVGYPGLSNLGATCYMNSLFQQLFMLPEFCDRILSVPCEREQANMLYQLQLMIVNLRGGLKKFYSTIGFCGTYKDKDGQIVNPRIQMDVDEFLVILFDRIEILLKGTPQERLLNEIYGGETVNQIISLECPHTTERVEPFFTLSLEVKNQHKIEKSLELFIQDDILDGDNKYHCSQCNAKVSAKKRCLLKTLPRHLIVHLKRFEYDLELDRRSKVTQRCDFPEILNLEPFTVQGAIRKENKEFEIDPVPQDYKLVGVLVHRGTTDSGHYYSFIKDRKGDNWFQFNDDCVTPFNPQDIPDECFGGGNNNFSKSNSAYMLFYEKCDAPKPTLALNQDIDIYQNVWKENQQFLTEKMLIEPNYIHFVEQIILEITTSYLVDDVAIRVLQLGITFLVKIASHTDEMKSETVGQIFHYISQLMVDKPEVCRWFISEALEHRWVLEMVCCNTPNFRFGFHTLLRVALAILKEDYDASERDETPVHEKAVDSNEKMDVENIVPVRPIPLFEKFLEHLINTLVDRQQLWRMHLTYWSLIEFYLYNYPPCCRMIVESGFLKSMINTYLSWNSQTALSAKMNRHPYEEKVLIDQIIFRIIHCIVCSCTIPPSVADIEKKADSATEGYTNQLVLPRDVLEMLCLKENLFKRFSNFFCTTIIIDESFCVLLLNMLRHLCANNEENTAAVMKSLAWAISQETYSGDDLGKVLHIYSILLDIDDNLQDYKCNTSMIMLIKLMEAKAEDPKAIDDCIIFQKYFCDLVASSPNLGDYLFKNFELWKDWLYVDTSDNPAKEKICEIAVHFIMANLVEETKLLIWNGLIKYLRSLSMEEPGAYFNGFRLFGFISELARGLKKSDILEFVQVVIPHTFNYLNICEEMENGESEVQPHELDNLAALFDSIYEIFFDEKNSELQEDGEIMDSILNFVKANAGKVRLTITPKVKLTKLRRQETLLTSVYDVVAAACSKREDVLEAFVGADFGFLCRLILLDPIAMHRPLHGKNKSHNNFSSLSEFLFTRVLHEKKFISYCCEDPKFLPNLVTRGDPLANNTQLSKQDIATFEQHYTGFWMGILRNASITDTLRFIQNKGLVLFTQAEIARDTFSVITHKLKDFQIQEKTQNILKDAVKDRVLYIARAGVLGNLSDKFIKTFTKIVSSLCKIFPVTVEPLFQFLCENFYQPKYTNKQKKMVELIYRTIDDIFRAEFEHSILLSIFEVLTSQNVLCVYSVSVLYSIVNTDIGFDLFRNLNRDKIAKLQILLQNVTQKERDNEYNILCQKLSLLVKTETDSELTQDISTFPSYPLDPANTDPDNTD